MRPLDDLISEFNREGFLVIPDVLTVAEVDALRAGVAKDFETDDPEATMYHMNNMWRPKMFEHGPEFEAIVDHPIMDPLISSLLGDDCHLIANSALKTRQGEGVVFWHADDVIRFPRPKGVPLDERIPMPNVIINLNYYLCDVDEDLGPTQFVPRSHRSGRNPDPEDYDANGNPTYEGRSMLSAVGKAGTVVMWNDQTWHRGGPNNDPSRVRWVLQAPFGRRYVAQRFYPFIEYRLPEGLLERSSEKRRTRLGVHGIGAYG